MNNASLTATEFRNRCFEILTLTSKGDEFVIEKDGRPAARLIPYEPKVSPKKVKRILDNFRSAFGKKRLNEPWSILETPDWKKKEKNYLSTLTLNDAPRKK
ncbi:MAG: type II toxin-antitoxin system Phd/YefM family antitoxin [Candidatus Levyibacteriota bacterium]